MSAESRHRAEAFDRHRDQQGLVRCALRLEDGHRCGGRLQADHRIPRQTLKRLHQQARIEGRRPGGELRPILDFSLDELIADGRNSAIVCEIGHRQLEQGRFELEPDEGLREFATDTGLEHYLPAAAA